MIGLKVVCFKLGTWYPLNGCSSFQSCHVFPHPESTILNPEEPQRPHVPPKGHTTKPQQSCSCQSLCRWLRWFFLLHYHLRLGIRRDGEDVPRIGGSTAKCERTGGKVVDVSCDWAIPATANNLLKQMDFSLQKHAKTVFPWEAERNKPVSWQDLVTKSMDCVPGGFCANMGGGQPWPALLSTSGMAHSEASHLAECGGTFETDAHIE